MLGYHHPDYKKNVQGCNIHYPYYLNVNNVAKFQVRPDDVAICGFPKSGTVWFCSVVGLILNDADPKFILDLPVLEKKVPFLEFCTPQLNQGYRGVDALEQMTGRRLFFSHLKADLLPPALFTSGAKVIYKTRNPKDSLMSLHCHHLARPASQYHGTLDDMVHEYGEDTVPFGPYFDHLASYWEHRDNPNLFFTSYEELQKDQKGTIRQLAKFLGKSMTDEQVDAIAKYTTFEAMKENPVVNRTDKVQAGVFDFKIVPFMRKGKMDSHKDELSAQQIAILDSWISRNKAREDLKDMPSIQNY